MTRLAVTVLILALVYVGGSLLKDLDSTFGAGAKALVSSLKK